MKKLVGKYTLGLRMVRLYIDTGSANGEVAFLPYDFGSTKIYVGIDCPFSESLAILFHEAYEACLIDLSTRFKKSPSYSSESSDYIFVMTHNELGEAHERVGIFISQAYEDFSRQYEKYSKKIRKK